MKKIFICTILAILFCLFAGIYMYNYGNYIVVNTYEESDNNHSNETIDNNDFLIKNREAALAIGNAILKEHFYNSYQNIKDNIVLREEGEYWIVYNEIKVSRNYLKKYSVKGGELYVKFSKIDGRIEKVGIND